MLETDNVLLSFYCNLNLTGSFLLNTILNNIKKIFKAKLIRK